MFYASKITLNSTYESLIKEGQFGRNNASFEDLNDMDNSEKLYSLKVKQVEFFDEINALERRKDIFCLHIFIDQTNERKLK